MHKTMKALLAAMLLAGGANAQPVFDEDLTFTHNGDIDYVLLSVGTPDIYAEPLPAPDPTINLEVGKRYRFAIANHTMHPFEIVKRGNNPIFDEVLLSMDADSGPVNAEFESDPAVDWVELGETVTFTLTQQLADRLTAGGAEAGYRCRPHFAQMRGIINIVASTEPTPTPTPEPTATPEPTVATPTPTVTPTPTPAGPSNDPAIVTTTLNSTQWETFSVPGVFDVPVFDENGGLGFTVNPGGGVTFGGWITRLDLNALPAGLIKMTTTLETTAPTATSRQPEVRVRVFAADNSQTALTVAAQAGAAVLPNNLETYFKSDGTTPFRVAFDVIGALPETEGTVRITGINVEMVSQGHSHSSQ